jgi:tetratricopeptide (TPR) repeat protein
VSTAPDYNLTDLLEDARYEEALAVVDAALLDDPDSAVLRSLRALILLETEQRNEAHRMAVLARVLDPDNAFVHYVYGTVALRRGEIRECIDAARIAQALDPADEEFILLEARARGQLGEWKQVALLADQVLARIPDHEAAGTIRVVALHAQSTGPSQEKMWNEFAERFPLNPWGRTGRAWSLLERGKVRDAQGEFEQALALDPSSEWARGGLAIALKGRNPVYALLLRYFMWMEQLPQRTRTLLILGGFFGYRGLRSVSRSNPEIAPLITPVLILYAVFVLLTWLADPLLNLLLIARKDGRRLLTADQQAGAVAVGGCLAAAVILGVAAWVTGLEDALLSAVGLGLVSIAVAAVFRAEPGSSRRRWMRLVTLALVLMALGSAGISGLFLPVVLGVAVLTWTTALAPERGRETRLAAGVKKR